MKPITIFAVLAFIFTMGCSKDNGATTDAVAGQWKLVNVSGTFAGIDNDFDAGLITWDFNPITQTVSVVNNNTDADKWDVFETGVYNYLIVDNPEFPCGEILKIDGIEMGCFSITGQDLTIDQSIADGFTVRLTQ